MSNDLERLAVALAAPVVRHQGGDDRQFGGALVPERARILLDTLFLVKSGIDVRDLLRLMHDHGQRAEWAQYLYHSSRDDWTPGPEDHSVLRKRDFAATRHTELGERGLLALDAMRSCAISGWAYAARWLSREQALGAIGVNLLARTIREHSSWSDVSTQLLLAFEFTDGVVAPDVEATIRSLETGDGPWRDLAWPPSLQASTRHDDANLPSEDGPLPSAIVAVQVRVDCPGCGWPMSPTGITAVATCARCASVTKLTADQWTYWLGRNVAQAVNARLADPFVTDFGNLFFSRSETRKVDSVACHCGRSLGVIDKPGETTCETCGAISVARLADENARAIHPSIRLIVEQRPGPQRDAPSSVPCAACAAAVPLDASTTRVTRCPQRQSRTFVDNATWAAWHGSGRRPVWHLIT